MRKAFVAVAIVILLAGCPTSSVVFVLNGSSRTVTEVYVVTCDATSWGSNLLREDLLPDEIDSVGAYSIGCYDVRAVDSRGATWTFLDSDFASYTETFFLQD